MYQCNVVQQSVSIDEFTPDHDKTCLCLKKKRENSSTSLVRRFRRIASRFGHGETKLSRIILRLDHSFHCPFGEAVKLTGQRDDYYGDRRKEGRKEGDVIYTRAE